MYRVFVIFDYSGLQMTTDCRSNLRGSQTWFYYLLMTRVKIAYLFLHTVPVVS